MADERRPNAAGHRLTRPPWLAIGAGALAIAAAAVLIALRPWEQAGPAPSKQTGPAPANKASYAAALSDAAPDAGAGRLAAQLAAAERASTAQGYARVAGPFSGALAQGGSRGFSITLRAGGEYRIVGVCDADCSGLSLQLRDRNAELVAESAERDGMTMLATLPRGTGRFTVDVTMRACAATAPCQFAFNVYGR